MKMPYFKQVITILCLVIGCNSAPSDAGPEPHVKPLITSHDELMLTDKQKVVLQMIHQFSWSAQKIYTYNDIIALDEERYTLSHDSLDIEQFKHDDKENSLYKMVENLKNLIFDFKEAELERKALEEFRRDEQIIDILENANLFKGVNSDYKKLRGDPYTELGVMGTKLLVNIGDGISNYMLIRKKMELKLKKEKYELDKKKRQKLHESLQNFEKNLKNIIVDSLPRDKELRTTLEHIEILVDEVKKADLQSIPLGITDNEKAKDLKDFLLRNERYYRYFPMYWYYRGLCEEKLGCYIDAINAYKQYQDLDTGLIKWNRISASVAMNITRLLLNIEGEHKREIYHQLDILDNNTTIKGEDWNFPYFAGLIYLHKFNDIVQAKRELYIAQEKAHRVFLNDWEHLKKELKENDEIKIPASNPKDMKNICGNAEEILPSGNNLYLCRLALNQAKMLEAGKQLEENSQLIHDLEKLASEETTSLFEGLNYFGSTNSSIFIEQYLKELASIRISVNYEVGIDELIVTLPLKCFLLKEVYPTLHLFTFNDYTHKHESSKVKSLYDEKLVTRRRSDGFEEKKKEMVLKTKLYDRYEDRILTSHQKIKIFFDVEVDEMKEANVEYLELRIPHGDSQYISVLFDIDDIFNENIIDPYMFARAIIYDGKLYRLFGNVVATDYDDTFDKCRGGGTWWDSPQRCNGWRFQSLKWPGGNLRIVDNHNRVRLSFPKDNEEAMKIKDRLWEDICKQLENDNYWNEWLKNNPPVSISSDNHHLIIHQLFQKTRE